MPRNHAPILQGTASLAATLAALPALKAQGRQAAEDRALERELTQSNIGYRQAASRKYGAEADTLAAELAAFTEARNQLAGGGEYDQRLRTFHGLGGGNVESLAGALGKLQEQDLNQQIVAGDLPEESLARALAVSGAKPIYDQSGGITLNQYTGDIDDEPFRFRENLEAEISRRGQDVTAATARRGQDIDAQTKLTESRRSGLPSGYEYVDPQRGNAIRPIAGSGPAFDRAKNLRSEYTTASKDFVAQNDAYGRIQASAEDPSAAGDLAMIFNYMKLLDPGSVVRESEFATAAASGSYGDRIQALVQRVASGRRLSDEQRRDFVDRSHRLYQKAADLHSKRTTEYERLAQQLNVPTEQVLYDVTLFGGGGPDGSGGAASPAPSSPNPPPDLPDARWDAERGAFIVVRDGKTYVVAP